MQSLAQVGLDPFEQDHDGAQPGADNPLPAPYTLQCRVDGTATGWVNARMGAHWSVIVNLLAGSLLGAYAGAEWATRLKTETLYRVIAVLLVIIAGVLLLAHDTTMAAPAFTGWVQVAAAEWAAANCGPNQLTSCLRMAGHLLPKGLPHGIRRICRVSSLRRCRKFRCRYLRSYGIAQLITSAL
jgi:hypothetical protein